MSIKLELFKKRYALFYKSIGNAYIVLSKLQGTLSYQGVSDMLYKGNAIHIHYKLELRRYVDRKVTIKQIDIIKKYPLFDIKKSEELPSNLLPLPTTTSRLAENTSKISTQQSQVVNVREANNEEGVKHQPKKQSQMVEEHQPQLEESSGITHPLSVDLKILPKADFTQYLGQLKATKSIIDKQGIDIKELVEYDKISFSCKFLTIYGEQLPKQQEDFINAKVVDNESVVKCKELIVELFKRKGQMERNIGSGKLPPDEYHSVLKNEFDSMLKKAKFVKKVVKNDHVFKFMYAKVQIIDSEIKELEEFLKSSN